MSDSSTEPPKITDGTLYKVIRNNLPIKVTAKNPKDQPEAEMLQFMVNNDNRVHHAALHGIREKK